MNRLLLHIALLLCAPRSFGYAIRTGLISAFAMRLYRQNKRKVFGDYNCFPLRTAIYICFPLRTAIYICCPLRTANVVSLYSKRSDNISARTGMLRIDGGTPSGYKGPNVSHFHLNGKKEHIFNINRWPWKK